jgi:hypothetical protein
MGKTRVFPSYGDLIASPLPTTTPLQSINMTQSCPRDMSVYGENKSYPSQWYTYTLGSGLNKNLTHVTHLAIHLYPIRYNPIEQVLLAAEDATIMFSYDAPVTSVFNSKNEYDLLVIAPEIFAANLQELINHKNIQGVSTLMVTTEEIYQEYEGRDKPEKIKYCIKDAIENWGIHYVLLVGGLKSQIYADPKDDRNQGSRGWYVPVRYSNLRTYEPGYLCDLYYADIYREGGDFDDWDSNGNGIFAEWKNFNSDTLDLYPDVYVGRLACRNKWEVQDVVSKIITYETGLCDPSWFHRIIGVGGDSFLDQSDLDISWDTTSLNDGGYTIFAQSVNNQGVQGPLEIINITLDKSMGTHLHFNHEDHLKVTEYPASPIAEIVTVSEGDILGNTDYSYVPGDGEAYCNDFTGWANVQYENGILHIRGKSYDPQPYGDITHFHVWITNSDDEIVFSEWKNDTKNYAEGDWIVGERVLHGRGGCMSYMPPEFERMFISTSNGKFVGMNSVMDTVNMGSGFWVFSGHGSPGVLANHLPGIPGNRQNSGVTGLIVTNVNSTFPYYTRPFLPLNTLENTDRLPVAVVSLGCHDAMFNVSLVTSLFDYYLHLSMHTYGHPIPECLCWYLVKVPRTGAIASIGYSGYGWGHLGEWHTIAGLDGWISTEFFRQYGTDNQVILGGAHGQALTEYINHFMEYRGPDGTDDGWDIGDQMTVEGWVLLGDPSLQIGGIPAY